MQLTAEQLAVRANMADQQKQNWIPMLRDAYEFALPMRNLYEVTQPSTEKMDRVFDSTAINSTQKFATRMQAGIVPPFQKWQTFEPGPETPDAIKPAVIKKLQKIREQFFSLIHNSNFDTSSSEFFMDLASGTGVLLVLEGDDRNPIQFSAVPNAQISMDEGPMGGIDGVFRTHTIPLRNVELTWKDVNANGKTEINKKLTENPNSKVSLLEATYFDPDTNKFRYEVMIKQFTTDPTVGVDVLPGQGQVVGGTKLRIVERELEESPWIITRWIKVAGEVFGRGPLLFALPDIRTVNKVKEMILQRASFDVAGMWSAVDDGVMNPFTIEIAPGNIIPVAAQGNLQALEPSGSFDVSQIILADLQANIKQALLDRGIPDETASVRSPTEIVERIKELQVDIGSPFARIMSEFIIPLTNRVLGIGGRRGDIDTKIVVDGKRVKIVPTSPLATQQNLDDLQSTVQWLQINTGLGMEVAGLGIKLEDFPAWSAEKLGVDQNLVRDDVERGALQQAVAQMIAQAQQQEPANENPQASTEATARAA